MPTTSTPLIDPALAAAISDALAIDTADQAVIDDLYERCEALTDAVSGLQWRAHDALDATPGPRRDIAAASALLAAVTVLIEGAAR